MICAYWIPYALDTVANPTGSVTRGVDVRTSNGHRKLFHDQTNVKIATAEIAGRDNGRKIRA
jgi:hypothetical protein